MSAAGHRREASGSAPSAGAGPAQAQTPVPVPVPVPVPNQASACIDIRGVACPLTWVRTRVALERLAAGEALEVTLLAGEPLRNVPRTAEEEGHRLAASEPRPELGEGAWRILLVKGGGGARAAPGDAEELLP